MKKFVIFLLLIYSLSLVSQTRTDLWYFGKNAGIHINPITKELTVLENGNIFAPANSSIATSSNGELAFYTNGSVVTNNLHQFINTNRGIGGEFDKAQTSLIIPKQNHPNLYYLITARDKPSPNIFDPVSPGLYFSEIDANTQNFTRKRTQILDLPVKKITAVHHTNGKDIWMVTIGMHIFENSTTPSRAFYSIKVTENGLEEPIITKIVGNNLPLNGSFKISPDGTKIAFASLEDGIFVYNFNTFDGSISNSLNIPKINPIKTYKVFGIEFSKNTNYLYTSSEFEDGTSFIHQYDLTFNNIQRKFTPIFQSTNKNNYGALQLAIDGKIYHSINFGNSLTEFGNHLGVINNPEKEGVNANYVHNAINLGKGNSFKSLPNFIQSYFNTTIKTTKGCVNLPTTFEAKSYTEINDVSWNFGDGTISNEIHPKHIYTSTGIFLVSAIISYDNQKVKIEKEIEIFPLPTIINNSKLVQCTINNISQTAFNLENINAKVTLNSIDKRFTYFENKADAISGSNKISTPTNYKINGTKQELFVRVIDANDCYSIANFFIETTSPVIETFNNIYACNDSNNEGTFDLSEKKNEIINQLNLTANSELNLYPTALDAQLKQNSIDHNYKTITTTIWARIDSNTGCGSISPIKLIVNSLPDLSNINDNYNICYLSEFHSPLILDANISNEQFEWKNSNGRVLSNQRLFQVQFPGTYTVNVKKTANNILCKNSKTFVVKLYSSPVFENISILTEELKTNVSVVISGTSTYNFSLDNKIFTGNSTSYLFKDVSPGIRTIYVKDANNCEPPIKKEITILNFPMSFTPNDDGINDRWNIIGGTKEYFKTVSVHIFDRLGNLLYTINNQNRDYGWDGNSRGIKLPSNDYWFTAVLEDNNGNIIKKTGHFSLLRK